MADSESIGRGSKRSFIGKRRAGSTASSKRSQHRPATSEKVEPPPPVPATEHREGSTRSKKSKAGGLLSCLPCFAPKESPADEESAENAKQAAKIKPGRTTQSAPLKKADPNAAESSTADSKEPLDEKSGESYGAEREKLAHGDGATDRKPSTEAAPIIVTRSSSKKQTPDAPLPPLPSQPGRLETNAIPQIGVQGPTPGTTPVQSRPSTDGEQMIHDQTPEQQQRDADIEMRDVPISSNDVPTDESTSGDPPQKAPGPIDLPPPPPLQQREKEVESQRVSEHEVSTPSRPYLLPAIRPEFKGKKCLVLDLDETLVHSSFKVSKSTIIVASLY